MYGLAAVAFPRSKSALASCPLPLTATPAQWMQTASPWNMKKSQLLAELGERGVTVHPNWTVPELRSILVEQRPLERPPKEEDKMKGLTKMTLAQLVAEAEKEGIQMPAKPTRGLMMRLLRDARTTPGCTIVPFGRYKGWMYQKVPAQYLPWAIREIKNDPNAHEDLVRLATWGSQEMERRDAAPGYVKKKDVGRDPEALAVVPPPSMASEKWPASSSEGSWAKVYTQSQGSRKVKAE